MCFPSGSSTLTTNQKMRGHSPNQNDLSFYRPEAIAARKDSWLGQTVVLRPLTVTITAVMGIAVVALILLFVYFGEYTRRVRLGGTVTPTAGIVRVFAPNAGRVVSLNAVEGGVVRQGQSLYTIASDSVTALGETYAAVAQELHKQRVELASEITRNEALAKVEKAGLFEQEQGLLREIEQIKAQLRATEAYAAVLRTTSETYRSLVQKHIVLQREAFDRMESQMRKEQELESLRREAIQLDQKLVDLRTKLAGFDSRSATTISELQRQISVIDRELVEGEARRQIEVIAPKAGTVTAVLVQSGQMVVAGARLLSILPNEAELEVQLFGSSSMIGFMREKAEVMLRYAAFPYQKFGLHRGLVTSFSRVTLRQGDAESMGDFAPFAREGHSKDAGVYRVIVRPQSNYVEAYGKAEPIRPGMAVEADIFLDTRPIYEWLLEPLYSLRGTLKQADPGS